jgi:hypothetical protein
MSVLLGHVEWELAEPYAHINKSFQPVGIFLKLNDCKFLSYGGKPLKYGFSLYN